MQIAEFFINLGIKGADKTVGALKDVKSGLSGAKEMSLEAKAGILGAVWALEQMVSKAGANGTAMTQFNLQTGQSMQTLQKWQFAARKAGESNESLQSSIVGIQDSMARMQQTGHAPANFGLFLTRLKSMGESFDVNKAYKDSFYVAEKINKVVNSGMSESMGKAIATSMGASVTTFGSMRAGVFNQKNFDAAPLLSDRVLKGNQKAQASWVELGEQMMRAMSRFNADHGLKLVEDISKIAEKVVTLIESFTKLAETLKIFKLVGMIFEGWGIIFDSINGTIKSITKDNKEDKGVLSNTWSMTKNAGKATWDSTVGLVEASGGLGSMGNDLIREGASAAYNGISGAISPNPSGSGGGNVIHMTNNFAGSRVSDDGTAKLKVEVRAAMGTRSKGAVK